MNEVNWSPVNLNGSYYSAEPIELKIQGTNLIAVCKFHSTVSMQLIIQDEGKKLFENFYSPFQEDTSFHGDIACRIGVGKMTLIVCFDLIHDRVGIVSSCMFIYDLNGFQFKWTGSVYSGNIFESDSLIAFVLEENNQKKYVVMDMNHPEKISETPDHPRRSVIEKKSDNPKTTDANLSLNEIETIQKIAQIKNSGGTDKSKKKDVSATSDYINQITIEELEKFRKQFALRVSKHRKFRLIFLLLAFSGMVLVHPFFGEKFGVESSMMVMLALIMVVTGSTLFLILNYRLRNKLVIPLAEHSKLNRHIIAPVLNQQFESARLIEKTFPFELVPQDSFFEPFEVPLFKTVNKSPFYYQCKINDLAFLFSYVKMDYKCKPDSDELLKRFHGIMLVSPLRNEISFTVHIRDLSLQSILNRSLTPDKIQTMSKIDLVDPVFKEIFEVWTDDPVMARYIVNPKEMEELRQLREIAARPVEFFVNGYNQFLLIHQNDNPLEISLTKKIDKQFVKKLECEFEKMSSLIKLVQTEIPKNG